ncbi:MAG: hypothetical protein NT093_01925 [Candidatus Moranbacteria bacterium]|nr:hypothetical protein [Candidatus Moranbacteria bacterium]
MGKRLLTVFLAFFFFVGLCSHVEARPCPEKEKKSFLQQGIDDLVVMDAIGEIEDPDKRAAAIRQFLDEIKPILDQAVKNGLKKFAWNVSGDNWWIIYEKGTCASAYLCVGKPPSDATILGSKGERL